MVEVGKTWDWSSYADTSPRTQRTSSTRWATWRAAKTIREWIVSTMNTFPGSEMPSYPVTWYSIDVDKGWVIFKNINTMKDPGDGSVHGAAVITCCEYAGDDKWSYEEDAYNPMNFMLMIQRYIQRCHELGHHLRRRPHVRQEHELGTGLTDYEVVGIRLTGPGPVVDEAPRAQRVNFAEAVLEERMLDRGL